VYCCKRILHYRLSSETFGYTLVRLERQNVRTLDMSVADSNYNFKTCSLYIV